MRQRLVSIDLLRGLTIILMVLANSPGSWSHMAAPLRHSAWNGLTLTDVIFPCFMFIMGMTTYISLRKFDFALSQRSLTKILRRAVVLFLLGLLVNWAVAGFTELQGVRVLGVLQRFAICYLVVSLLGLTIGVRRMAYIAVVLLVGYAVALLAFNGYAYDESNILSVIDRACLGRNMYNDGGIDPEGLLSTLPSIAHVIIGYCMGSVALSGGKLADRVINMAQWGIMLLFAGLLADCFLPMNKKIWSPSFVLATCGISLLALVLLAIMFDIKGMKMPRKAFLVFGVNPLACYVFSQLFCVALRLLRFSGISLQDHAYFALASAFGDNAFSSFLSALATTFVVGVFGWILYARRIYIKI